MSDTYNKPLHGNNYNHWKILDILSDLKYISFSNTNAKPNWNTHLNIKPQTLIISFHSAFDM